MPEENKENLTKEFLQKVVDDPYFQYLVEKKARSQVRTFLVGVGTLILAVLAYGGWEFKSAKGEIEKKQTEFNKAADDKSKIIEEKTKIIENKADLITKSSEQIQNTVGDINQKIGQSQRLLTDAQGHLSSSKTDASQIIDASRRNLEGFTNMQNSLLVAQGKLLAQSEVVASGANNAAAEAKKILKELKDAEVEKKLQQIANHAGEVEQITDRVQRGEIAMKTATKDVLKLTEQVTAIQSIKEEIQKARLNELVLITTRESRIVQVNDPKSNDMYFIKFTCSNIGKRKTLKLKILVTRHTGPKFQERFPESNLEVAVNSTSADPYDIENTPFLLKFDFAYHALMSADFIALRVIPKG